MHVVLFYVSIIVTVQYTHSYVLSIIKNEICLKE